MFARRVAMKLKRYSAREFAQTVETHVIPLIRRQPGFRDWLTFIATGETEAVEISLWDRRESAEAYNNGPYSEVLELLGTVVDGTPEVQGGEVSNSTIHRIPATPVAW